MGKKLNGKGICRSMQRITDKINSLTGEFSCITIEGTTYSSGKNGREFHLSIAMGDDYQQLYFSDLDEIRDFVNHLEGR